MPKKKRTSPRGRCFLCGYSSTKGGITRHLKKHIAEYRGNTPLAWVRVTDQTPWSASASSAYWLDLEMPVNLVLSRLDSFLRSVWVECCGHLSRFVIRRGRDEILSIERISEEDRAEAKMWARYKANPQAVIREVAQAEHIPYQEAQRSLLFWAIMRGTRPPQRDIRETTLSDLLKLTDQWEYEYDFGTTTHLHLKVMARYQGPKPPAKAPIRILSRNYKPLILCAECRQPAEYWELSQGVPRPLCAHHLEESLSEYYLPIVNSPRTGLCGYNGPVATELVFEEVYLPENEE